MLPSSHQHGWSGTQKDVARAHFLVHIRRRYHAQLAQSIARLRNAAEYPLRIAQSSLFPAQRHMHARNDCALTRRRMRNSTCDSKSIAHCLVMDCATVSWEKILRRLEKIIAFHRSEGY